MKIRMTVSAVSLIAFAGLAAAEPAVLRTQSGMTVYTFDRDSGGQSRCEGACATIWPPVRPVDIESASIQMIVRDDGSRQAVYNGGPLYLFVADRKSGDRKGDDVDGVWHVVPLGARTGGIVRSTQKRGAYLSGGYDEHCGH